MEPFSAEITSRRAQTPTRAAAKVKIIASNLLTMLDKGFSTSYQEWIQAERQPSGMWAFFKRSKRHLPPHPHGSLSGCDDISSQPLKNRDGSPFRVATAEETFNYIREWNERAAQRAKAANDRIGRTRFETKIYTPDTFAWHWNMLLRNERRATTSYVKAAVLFNSPEPPAGTSFGSWPILNA